MKDIGKIPCNSIENILVICPECQDTKSVKVDSTVKISWPPIYTLTCDACDIKWEANLTSE